MSSCCPPESSQTQPPSSLSIALVGNPNCGKTTLFNALTGARQKIGNWPGVTVERKSGFFTEAKVTVEAIDLPGVYSLTMVSDKAAIDERIASEYVLSRKADVIVNIVDASNLERHLYLSMQLLEMGVPIILALNMMDVARARNIQIDINKLSQQLQCPVIALEANKKTGVAELKQAIVSLSLRTSTVIARSVFCDEAIQKDVLSQSIQALTNTLKQHQIASPNYTWLAIHLLEDDLHARSLVTPEILQQVQLQQDFICQTFNEDADILIADARYQHIQQLFQACVTQSKSTKPTWTSRIDNIVLNRFLGIPIFLGIMYLLFVFAINVGGAFQDFFDISSQTIFVDGFAHWLEYLGAPVWLIALLASGIGKGINTTVTFIPVIGSMFLFLALLEDSGYMARAAFVIDRFMRTLGLPGKAFVPMIVGFGCNVPAVMGARTLENRRDRILTIMMAPFMSCGARLAIFAVFTTAFFPRGGQNIVFALYITGIVMAVLTGFLLRWSVLKGEPSPLVMELPIYHVPRFKSLLIHAWQRLKGFVIRAGRLIVPICVLIGALNAINIDGTMNSGEGDTHSLLSLVGQWVTPLFHPMGIHTDNWPATVGLVTGVLAKEVVVGTLNSLYTQVGHFASSAGDTFQLSTGLLQALQSIPQNLSELSNVFGNPVLAQAPISSMNQGVYGLMYQKFDGQAGAFAYLLFVLLYFPCISTMAVMMRELHKGWAIFSALWMTGVAYGVAVAFYQAATWMKHPASSTVWLVWIAFVFFSVIIGIRWFADRQQATTTQAIGETA